MTDLIKISCANCGNSLEGNFCSKCGQKSGIRRLNMKELFSIIPSAILLFESRYWHTIRDFIKNPLKMIKDYSEGKRKYYASPVQFFYFFATLSFILYEFLPSEDVSAESLELSTKIAKIIPGPLGKRLIESGYYWAQLTDNYTNLFELGMPFVFGFLVFLFYRKIMNLAESLAFTFLLMTFVIEISTLISIPFLNTKLESPTDYILTILPVVYVFYRIGEKKILNVFLGITLSILSILLYSIITFLCVFLLYPFIS